MRPGDEEGAYDMRIGRKEQRLNRRKEVEDNEKRKSHTRLERVEGERRQEQTVLLQNRTLTISDEAMSE